MKDNDTTPVFLGVAAIAVALWLHVKSGESQMALVQCNADFRAFKEGVLYGR
ncbi:hypothetical protein NIES4075_72950 [Tolypothrix sp. NIES-4075]|uniref:hypothetical protein n=1 Tax=Tolypothrix sp. NIES-4075 TaxID=2005459 RepID=UPI000B671B50|nr:hypothetical protein [Tolypothrix sp. NIES-4075]GAX46274.1 hypothetical protein NIES4075_72950 [Tolypothrix sp. NIES-4075]